jgi:hypothetical protein
MVINFDNVPQKLPKMSKRQNADLHTFWHTVCFYDGSPTHHNQGERS